MFCSIETVDWQCVVLFGFFRWTHPLSSTFKIFIDVRSDLPNGQFIPGVPLFDTVAIDFTQGTDLSKMFTAAVVALKS